MKIGILTFHCAANYGAVLQSYGLQQTLKRMGHDVAVLNYRPDFLIRPYKPVRVFLPISRTRDTIRALISSPIRASRNRMFSRFIEDKINIIPFESVNDLDVIVFGSDQIWSHKIPYGQFDTTYFSDFKHKSNLRKIAYAASAGDSERFEQNADDTIKKLLRTFDAISVREAQLLEVINKFNLKSEPQLVLDPVLLAGRDCFDKLTQRELAPQEPYVLTFSLDYSPETSKLGKHIAASMGIRNIDMVSDYESVIQRQVIQTATVEKFLSLIKFAQHIVTTSFHGTAFSILFNKQFTTLGFSESHCERMRALFNILGVHNKIQLTNEHLQKAEEIDYNIVSQKLKEAQLRSERFIIESMRSE